MEVVKGTNFKVDILVQSTGEIDCTWRLVVRLRKWSLDGRIVRWLGLRRFHLIMLAQRMSTKSLYSSRRDTSVVMKSSTRQCGCQWHDPIPDLQERRPLLTLILLHGILDHFLAKHPNPLLNAMYNGLGPRCESSCHCGQQGVTFHG